jgi:hypothetical protein
MHDWQFGYHACAQVAVALERDAHATAIGRSTYTRATLLTWPSTRLVAACPETAQQAELKAAVQATPRTFGVKAAKWSWKAVR